ncbi:MAG TPA: integrin alpha, partial [bacterium]
MGTLLKRSLIRTAALECAFLWLQAVVPASAGYLQTPVGSFVGTHARERMSYELAPAGDVNGDGYADFMMGTFHSDFGDES